MSVEDAGAYYLSTVCPSNDLMESYFDSAGTVDLLSRDARGMAQTIADELGDVAAELQEPPAAWPDQVVGDIDAVIASTIEDAKMWRIVAGATTMDDLDRAAEQWQSLSRAPAERVRVKLELPSLGEGGEIRCSEAPSEPSPEAAQVETLVANACLTVDGSAHGELAPDLLAQAEAQAKERAVAASALESAQPDGTAYAELAARLTALADQSQENAYNLRNNPEQLAADMFEGGDSAPVVQAVTAARDACVAAGFATQ